MERKSIKQILKEYFFLNPTVRLRVRQIERETKTPLPSVIRYTKELKEEGILKSTKVANIIVYSANRSATEFLLEKSLTNIKHLFVSGLIHFIIEELSNPTIVVFGSYVRGEDVENSDIDLYIETPTKKTIRLDKFEKLLKRKIQLFIHSSIKDVKNKELANNILNGIKVNGYLKVFS